jgi:hypothetical protein
MRGIAMPKDGWVVYIIKISAFIPVTLIHPVLLTTKVMRSKGKGYLPKNCGPVKEKGRGTKEKGMMVTFIQIRRNRDLKYFILGRRRHAWVEDPFPSFFLSLSLFFSFSFFNVFIHSQ